MSRESRGTGSREQGAGKEKLLVIYQLPITNYQLPITNAQCPIPNSHLDCAAIRSEG
jgi:hypothetical protein